MLAEPDRLWRPDRPTAVVLQASARELSALDSFGMRGEWDVLGRTLQLIDLDKDLFQESPSGT